MKHSRDEIRYSLHAQASPAHKHLEWLILAVLLSACGSGGEDNSVEPDNQPGAQSNIPGNNVRFTKLHFSETGLNHIHLYSESNDSLSESQRFAGGAAAGDYDNDGLVDLYVVMGNTGSNRLYKNIGNNRFLDTTDAAGVNFVATQGSSGPAFADIDGDGFLDLFVGGIDGEPIKLFKNKADGTFDEITDSSGLNLTTANNISATFGDYDHDNLLDLFVTHWGNAVAPGDDTQHLWRNNGDLTFTNVSIASNISSSTIKENRDLSYTANFADINNDGFADLLIASDFNTSRILLNNGNGTFSNITTDVISDENGMGASVGDYDNDGDLDWFVTSIAVPNPLSNPNDEIFSGNRLYKNQGDGIFEDVTITAGVRYGYWGWASCMMDFNNDGHLDIFHVNGWSHPNYSAYHSNPSRLFISTGNGDFIERAPHSNIIDTGQGRGLVCADFDRDGDIDILVANNNQPPSYYRNDTNNNLNYLHVKLKGIAPNTEAIGARIHISSSGTTQIRELQSGNNYVSQNPAEAYFGLGNTTTADVVNVTWPNGQTSTYENVTGNQFLILEQPGL